MMMVTVVDAGLAVTEAAMELWRIKSHLMAGPTTGQISELRRAEEGLYSACSALETAKKR